MTSWWDEHPGSPPRLSDSSRGDAGHRYSVEWAGGPCPSCVWSGSRAAIVCKSSVLLGRPFPVPGFRGQALVHRCPLAFPEANFFGCRKQRKPGSSPRVRWGSRGPEAAAHPLLSTFQNLLTFGLRCSEFPVVHRRRTREQYIYPIFPQAEKSLCVISCNFLRIYNYFEIKS